MASKSNGNSKFFIIKIQISRVEQKYNSFFIRFLNRDSKLIKEYFRIEG